MHELMVLFDGTDVIENFYSDLSQVMDHSYNVDELFTFYPDWRKDGSLFVDYYVSRIYPVISGSTNEEQDDAKENQVALRNAMVNLYCALDKLMSNARVTKRVVHAAHHPDSSEILITVC